MPSDAKLGRNQTNSAYFGSSLFSEVFVGLGRLGIARIGLGLDFGSEGRGFESLRARFLRSHSNDRFVAPEPLVAATGRF